MGILILMGIIAGVPMLIYNFLKVMEICRKDDVNFTELFKVTIKNIVVPAIVTKFFLDLVQLIIEWESQLPY